MLKMKAYLAAVIVVVALSALVTQSEALIIPAQCEAFPSIGLISLFLAIFI